MLKIGLTGGIASGKSTVAKIFADLGVAIIDADQLAKKLLNPNSKYYQQVIEHFGLAVVNQHGKLDRSKLRRLIFTNNQARSWLNKLLHPVIKDQLIEWLSTIENDSQDNYCIVVVPLLVEVGWFDLVDKLLVITVDQSVQVSRLTSRDNYTSNEALAALNSQMTAEQRNSYADDLLENNGTLAQLKSTVIALHKKYISIS